MAIVTKRSLVMDFETPSKSKETITVGNPKEVLSGTKIKQAMTDALASGAIGEVIQATKIVGAKFVVQQVDEVDLEEA
ncbi:MAG: DUF2922 family protein [Niameybacter sp.]|uniref:DUF2922 family protein n=1 Tax=Niameybacter sp. TaxID=2033640 RepID=UPI002FCC4F42